MTKVTFEVAAFAAALAAAAKVAPTRGVDFEKAAGILLDVTSDECIVMATDTRVQYSTWLTPETFEGDPLSWRVPSRIFSELVGKLKTGINKTLTLEQDGQMLRLTHGRARATFTLLPAHDFPRWDPFLPDDMTEVFGLGKAVSAIVWAAAKTGEAPLIGVHFDGQNLMATDRYRFANTPFPVPLAAPITIPPTAIVGILKPTVSVQVRIDGTRLCIMPDDFTQISLTAYGVEYPALQRLMVREYPVMCTVNKQALLDIIDMAMTMAGTDRLPKLHLIFGRQSIAAMVENEQVGRAGNVVDVPDQLDFENRHEIRFNPDNFLAALNGCVGDKVKIGFDPAKPMAPVYMTGGEDLEFWLAPRQKTDPSAE